MTTELWEKIFSSIRFICWSALGMTGIGLLKVMIAELFCRFCPHCGKKV